VEQLGVKNCHKKINKIKWIRNSQLNQ